MQDHNQFDNGYEKWTQDHWNNQLWNRVTDINSCRTNIYVNRPEETGLGRKCSGFSYIHDKSLVNDNNLRNYQLEAQLQQLHIPNNRDTILDTPSTNPQCIYCRSIECICKERCLNPERICRHHYIRGSGLNFERLTLRKPTSERFRTTDQRLLFIPKDLC